MPVLHWPPFYQPPTSSSSRKGPFQPDMGYAHVTENLREQLRARQNRDSRVWGEDPLRVRVALLVCKRIQEIYAWPNDWFLPEDPFDIVFLVPWDDLEIAEVAMRLEEDLGIALKDEDLLAWGGTLSDVVDRIVARYRAHSRT